MCNKPEGELERKKNLLQKNLLRSKQVLLETEAIKQTKKIQERSCGIIRDSAQYNTGRNIGPSVCLILVIGSLKFSHVTNTNLHMFFRKSIDFLFRPVYGQSR